MKPPYVARTASPRLPCLVEPLEQRIAPANFTWIGGSGNWSDSSHWSGGTAGAIPGAGDDVAINPAGVQTITVNFTFAAHSLSMPGDDILNIVGGGDRGTLTLTAASTVHSVQIDGSGFLNAQGGATLTGNSVVNLGSLLTGATNTGSLLFEGAPGGRTEVRSLQNSGIVTMHTQLNVTSGGFANLAGGVVDFAVNTSSAQHFLTAGFSNAGTVRMSGTNSVDLFGTFNNLAGGIIDVPGGGVLGFQTTGDWNGAQFTLGNNSLVAMRAVQKTVHGNFSASGSGTIGIESGSVNIASDGATFNFPSGVLTWTTGVAIGGTGTLTNNGFMQLTNQAVSLNTTLLNHGTVITSGTTARLGMNATGVFSNASDGLYQINGTYSDAILGGRFDNAGIVRHAAATFTQTVTGTFNNLAGGRIEATVPAGSLNINQTGDWDGAQFSVAAGASIGIGNRAHTWTGAFTGTGGGIVAMNATGNDRITIGAAGATLNFPAGMLEWTDAQISGTGVLTNLGFIQMSSGRPTLHQIEMRNAGTMIESGGTFQVQDGARLENLAGSLFEITTTPRADFADVYYVNSGGVAIDNAGVFRYSGTRYAQGFGTFNNLPGGHIEVTGAAGALQLHDGGAWQGGHLVVTDAKATLLLGGNTKKLSGTFTGEGAGIVLTNGQLQVDAAGATFDFPENFFFEGPNGVIYGTGTLVNRGFIHLPAGSAASMRANIENHGTIRTEGGQLYLEAIYTTPQSSTGKPATLHNAADGVFDVTGAYNGPVLNGGAGHFDNDGTFLIEGIGNIQSVVPFHNSGLVEATGPGTFTFIFGKVDNVVGGTLTGGTWRVDAGGSLGFLPSPIVTNNAVVEIAGDAGSFDTIRTNNGTLRLFDGRDFSATSAFANNGTLVLGEDSTLSISGNLTLGANSTTEFELGGTPASGHFGKITATGAAALAGTAKFSLANGYGPASGQVFTLATFASETGAFAMFEGDVLQRTRVFDPKVTATQFVLNAIATTGDLSASNVAATTGSGLAGNNVTINYTVSNISPNRTLATAWTDSIYLSLDGTLDPSDKLVSRVPHSGALTAGTHYDGSVTAPLPGAIPSNYRFIVVADSRGESPDAERTNNTSVSSSLFALDVTQLTASVAANGTVAAGQDRWFRLDLPNGAASHFDLSLGAAGGAELYVRQGDTPTLATYDAVKFSPTATTLDITEQPTRVGTFYVLVHGREGAGAGTTFALSGEALPFGAFDLTTNHGAPAGSVTTVVHGSLFTGSTTFALVPATGPAIAASSVTILDAGTAWATFPLQGATLGDYDVRTTDGAANATLPDAFHVAAGVGGHFDFSLSTVPFTRPPFRNATLTLTYENTGDADIIAPMLVITGTNALLKLPEDSGFGASTLQVLAISADGPAGVLAPGARGQIELAFQPIDASAHAAYHFEAFVSSAPGYAIEWDAIKDALRPSIMPADAWSVVFTNFKSQVGDNAASLDATLAENATRLSAMGFRTSDVGRLLSFEFEEADNFGEISSRFQLGTLGRGQSGPFSIHATTDSDGSVTIINGGYLQSFVPVTGGGFHNATGEPATLTRDGQGALHLIDVTGFETIFRATDGRLAELIDTNDNTLTATYNLAGQITTITASNGDTITLTYESHGRIATSTDAVGRVTTFAYDASGEHLLSVTDAAGTATFTYASGSTQSAHAVTSITFPGGVQSLFSYDAQGRLAQTSGTGGAPAVNFAYDTAGGVTATDALGTSATQWRVPGGGVGRTFDDAGRLVSYAFPKGFGGNAGTAFADGSLVEVNTSLADGHTTLVNAIGHTTTYQFSGTPARLDTLTNPNGATTSFTYDADANVTSVTDAAGGVARFTYDAEGNRTSVVNERGQLISYTYNSKEQLISKDAPGTADDVNYAYDAHRNLLSATGAASATAFEYDAADRVTKVTYPGGTFVAYTYDAAGRRASISDGTFTTQYQYDVLGRLDTVRDGANNLVSDYTYDAAGRVASELHGNGSTTDYLYDSDGRVSSIIEHAPGGATIENTAYTYDAVGRVLTKTTTAGTTTYGYDLAGELIRVELPGGRTIAYAYDANGNRVSVVDSTAGTTNYATNNLDQYTGAGTATFTYDADGNLLTRTDASGITRFTYDAEGHLNAVFSPTSTIAFEYDALGNRVASVENGVRTSFLVDPTGLSSIVAEFDNSGAIRAHYVDGLGIESRVDAGGSMAFYHYDLTGNTDLLTGANGTVLNTYEYLPFGEKLASTGTTANPFTFNGAIGVREAGAGLYDMRARFYDPALGRFTQEDPLGFLAGDTNLYRYVGNSPISASDPSGLLTVPTITVAQGLQFVKLFGYIPFESSDLLLAESLFQPNGLPLPSPPPAPPAPISVEFNFPKPPGFFSKLAGELVAAAPSAGVGIGLGIIVADLGLRVFAPGVHDSLTQGIGDTFFNHPQDEINHDTETEITAIKHIKSNPQVLEQLKKTAIDPLHPTVQEVANATRDVSNTSLIAAYDQASLLHRLFPIVYPDPGPPPYRITPDGTIVFSGDPNNILGPVGFGHDVIADDPMTQLTRFDGFIPGSGEYEYQIIFENKPDASAPAQVVTITQTLDGDLDFSTFAFQSFGFGDFTVAVPAGQSGSTFHTRVDATATLGVLVDVDAALNVQTGALRVVFTSLDPTTLDLPLDPTVGLLPPNLTAPEGDGFVSYHVAPDTGLLNGTRIDAQATIVFDTNAAINTTAVHNTLDVQAPVSSVTALPGGSTVRPTFLVHWTGSDEAGGSGLASHNIFYSDNDGPRLALQLGTTAMSAPFVGAVGHTYKFFSSATDNTGNGESLSATPDATIAVVAPNFLEVGKKKVFTDADGDKVTISYKGPGAAKVALTSGGDSGAIDFLQVDGSTTKSKVSINVKKSGTGDGIVQIGDVTIAGSLAAFAAKTGDLVANGLSASGTVKAITVHDLVDNAEHTIIALGGSATDTTKVTAHTLADGFELSTPGIFSQIKAADIGSGSITAEAIGKLQVAGGKSGGSGSITGAVVNADKIAAILVAGNVTSATILAGASLGADHLLGGTGPSADTFVSGSIGKVQIKGDVTSTVIGAGLSSGDAIFHNADDVILGGAASSIGSFSIGGTANSDSYFAAGAFKKSPTIAGEKVDPATDTRFKLG